MASVVGAAVVYRLTVCGVCLSVRGVCVPSPLAFPHIPAGFAVANGLMLFAACCSVTAIATTTTYDPTNMQAAISPSLCYSIVVVSRCPHIEVLFFFFLRLWHSDNNTYALGIGRV